MEKMYVHETASMVRKALMAGIEISRLSTDGWRHVPGVPSYLDYAHGGPSERRPRLVDVIQN
jgi:hypothetical protein